MGDDEYTTLEKIGVIAVIFLILYLTSGGGDEFCNPISAYGLGC